MKRMFNHRYRGFRVVNFAALGILLVLMLGVYWAKTRAAADSSDIASLERQIVAKQHEIRILRAQVAGLETPERIAKLSSEQLGMAPIDAKHEALPEDVPRLAGAQSRVAAIAPPAGAVVR